VSFIHDFAKTQKRCPDCSCRSVPSAARGKVRTCPRCSFEWREGTGPPPLTPERRSGYRVGDRVKFGRPRGEKTLGDVVSVRPWKIGVRTLEPRGVLRIRPVGTVMCICPSLCRWVPGEEPEK